RTLPIPFQFCICELNKTKSEDQIYNEEIGRHTVKLLNFKLNQLNIENSCEQFTFKKTTEIKRIDKTNGLTEIDFATNECGAEYKTIVRARIDNNLLNVSLVANDFTRTNSYGSSGDCMSRRPNLRPLCCCKS
ncbi:hypothetical protein PENTCL1PPCAC_25115, partial [Pristionchus entomophagus]